MELCCMNLKERAIFIALGVGHWTQFVVKMPFSSANNKLLLSFNN